MKNKKKLSRISFVILILFNAVLQGQTTNDLDTKNGFKIFILGSPLENYKAYDNGMPAINGEKVISIEKSDYNRIGDIFIDNIRLEFLQNKLVSITVRMNYKYRKEIYDVLKEGYGLPNVKAYDEHYEYDVHTQKLAWIVTQAEWAGNNVLLKLYGDGTNGERYSDITLTFTSKETTKFIETEKKNNIKKSSKEL